MEIICKGLKEKKRKLIERSEKLNKEMSKLFSEKVEEIYKSSLSYEIKSQLFDLFLILSEKKSAYLTSYEIAKNIQETISRLPKDCVEEFFKSLISFARIDHLLCYTFFKNIEDLKEYLYSKEIFDLATKLARVSGRLASLYLKSLDKKRFSKALILKVYELSLTNEEAAYNFFENTCNFDGKAEILLNILLENKTKLRFSTYLAKYLPSILEFVPKDKLWSVFELAERLFSINEELFLEVFRNGRSVIPKISFEIFESFSKKFESVERRYPKKGAAFAREVFSHLTKIDKKTILYRISPYGFKLANVSQKVALAFFSSLPYIRKEIGENFLRRWMEFGHELALKDAKIGELYFKKSIRIMNKNDEDLFDHWFNKGFSIIFLDRIGARNYFEFSPLVVDEMRKEEFLKWIDEGTKAASFDPQFARAYFSPETEIGQLHIKRLLNRVFLKDISVMLKTIFRGISGKDVVILPKEGIEVEILEANPIILYMPKELPLFDEKDDNLSFFKLLAVKSAAKIEAGSPLNPLDERVVSFVSQFPKQDLASSIFWFVEEKRVENFVRSYYPGTVKYFERFSQKIEESRRRSLPAYLFDLPFEVEKRSNRLKELCDSFSLSKELYAIFENRLKKTEENRKEIEIFFSPIKIPKKMKNKTPLGKMFEKIDLDDKEFSKGKLEDGAGHLFLGEFEKEEFLKVEEEGGYKYDEWDKNLSAYKKRWCTLFEREVEEKRLGFYEKATEKYREILNLLKKQFLIIASKEYQTERKLYDGSEIDIDSVVDYLVDRRVGLNPEPRIYKEKVKKKRSVSSAFVLDISNSTYEKIGERRIIDVEKEALVLLSQVLEILGDEYAIYAFSSNGRDEVEFYVIKDFDDPLDEERKSKIGGISPKSNTRIAPVIRHTITKLVKRKARTKLIFVITDGRPNDVEYGDMRYALEDTKKAVLECVECAIHPFFITVYKEEKEFLERTYGRGRYIVLEDARELVEKLPMVYKRLTVW